MIERKPFEELPSEDLGWLKVRHHFPGGSLLSSPQVDWGCLQAWDDDEIAPNSGFALELHADIEIVIYVREGSVTHRDNLGNEGRITAGNVQVVSAGTGIRHSEYNLDLVPARIFQIWLAPDMPGGSPAWGTQPGSATESSACFVALASGIDSDWDALPVRACARVLNARLKVGDCIEHVLRESGLAYLVPSSGIIDVNGVRIHARDGTTIKDVAMVTIAAIEDADVVMIDGL